MPIKLSALAILLSVLPSVYANQTDPDTQAKLEDQPETAQDSENKIEVYGVTERLYKKGRLADVIEKTELIDEKTLERKQAMNLSEAIENEPGIRVNNECSMCGMKRVMINGLKGEHTTILVDGVPMHSVVSSYYGMDAITSAGIEQVEVARGSGASLIAPEAMGGTINIITKNAQSNTVSASAGIHDDGDRQLNLVATAVSKDKKTGLSAAAQFTEIDQFDADHNGVSESPRMNNQSVMIKLRQDINTFNTLEVKSSLFDSEVFGGPVETNLTDAILSEQNGATAPGHLFTNGNVNLPYLGQEWETTEAIQTQRKELMLRWTHEVNFDNHFVLTSSIIDHEQDSYYESFDYANTDDIQFLDFRWTHVVNGDWMLTFGSDSRDEKMRSQSRKLAQLQQADPSIKGDSFDYGVRGLYLQSTVYSSPSIEWNVAVRLDRIKTDWIEQTAAKYELDESLFTPRAHLRIDHNDEWTSRVSLGQGYRAPLTFFESDHGVLEDGFQIAINQLEKSKSLNYAISFEDSDLAVTTSVAFTKIENLAFIDTTHFVQPTLVNSNQTFDVKTIDLVYGYDINESWSWSGSFEWYGMDEDYKTTFGVVPIEKRIKAASTYQINDWEIYVDLTWIGSRDLRPYGYADRFNIFNDSNANDLVDPGELLDPKTTNARSFTLVNARFSLAMDETFSFFFGVKNLFDFTQVKDMDGPLFWTNDHGSPAYDVAHIYGPLRGREIYLGIKMDIQ